MNGRRRARKKTPAGAAADPRGNTSGEESAEAAAEGGAAAGPVAVLVAPAPGLAGHGGGALLTAGIVVFVLVGTHTGLFGGGKEMAPGSGFFSRPDDEPEMSKEGIKGVIREAYFHQG